MTTTPSPKGMSLKTGKTENTEISENFFKRPSSNPRKFCRRKTLSEIPVVALPNQDIKIEQKNVNNYSGDEILKMERVHPKIFDVKHSQGAKYVPPGTGYVSFTPDEEDSVNFEQNNVEVSVFKLYGRKDEITKKIRLKILRVYIMWWQ